MKTLFVSDLDGTLLTREERLSDYSLEHLNALLARGVNFTYATARSVGSAVRALQGLNISMPAVYYNGGLVYDRTSGKTLKYTCFEDSLKAYVLSVLESFGIMPFVYSATEKRENVVWRLGKESFGMKRYLNRRQGDCRLLVANTDAELLTGYVFYFKCIGPKEQIEQAWNVLKYDSRVICIFHQEMYQNDFWMEISPRDATKANAVAFLKEHLGYDKLVCFGDTSNDSDMFDVCDEKYAVKNADDWLKEKATGVIGYCEEDGVAKWMDENAFRG